MFSLDLWVIVKQTLKNADFSIKEMNALKMRWFAQVEIEIVLFHYWSNWWKTIEMLHGFGQVLFLNAHLCNL